MNQGSLGGWDHDLATHLGLGTGLEDLGLGLEHRGSGGVLLSLGLGSADSLVGGSGSWTDSRVVSNSKLDGIGLRGRRRVGRLLSSWLLGGLHGKLLGRPLGELLGGFLALRRSGDGASADGERSEGEHDDREGFDEVMR